MEERAFTRSSIKGMIVPFMHNTQQMGNMVDNGKFVG